MKAIKEVGLKETIKFAFYSIIQLFCLLAFIPPLRKVLLMLLGAKLGSGSILMNVKYFNLHHAGFRSFTIGKDCFIGDETLIDLYDRVTLEDQVTISQGVTVLTHMNVGYSDHPLQASFPKKSLPVLFKKGSVVGAASVILPGVTIGQNSFVAAGSVVTKDVAPNTLVAGVPARPIRSIK